MCGISGSIQKEQAFKLYQLNLDRGYYSSGYYNIQITTQPSTVVPFTLVKCKGLFNESQGDDNSIVKFHLYHSRGPTVETTGFVPDNNHPFIYGDWVVAHNGIISNFTELAKTYFPGEDFTGKTDSCIIPRLLHTRTTITEALELLQGTFALWMFNTKTRKLYIARSASTLFAAPNGDFSSTYFDGSQSLDEGVLYEIEDLSVLKKIGSFKFDSPYLVL